MRLSAIIILLSAFFAGCIEHQDSDGLDLVTIRQEAREVLGSCKVGVDVDISMYHAISSLNPLAVWCDNEGLYIMIDRFFASDSGLFIPRNGYRVNADGEEDPSYRYLGDHVYSYVIQG